MSIQSEINRIKASIAESYNAVSEMGGEIPEAEETRTINMLPAAIRTVSPPNLPAGVTLVSLDIQSLPIKTEYEAGEIFDPSGLTLTAELSNGIMLQLEQPFPTPVSFNPNGLLEVGLESITVELTWGDVMMSCSVPIAVVPPRRYEAGVDWWDLPLPYNMSWISIAYGNGKFIIIARETDKYIYSEDGINWDEGTFTLQADWYHIEYNDDRFVVISTAGDIACSEDGINWEVTRIITSDTIYGTWTAAIYGGGKFIAIKNNESRLAYSTDGVNWAVAQTYVDGAWYDIIYAGGKFVNVAANVTKVRYSEDGVSWKAAILAASNTLKDWPSIAYGNGKFVAICRSANVFSRSENAINWTSFSVHGRVPGQNSDWRAIVYGGDKFVSIATDGEELYSRDGIEWLSTHISDASVYWIGLAYGDGKFVALSNAAANKIAYSSADGPPT